MKRKWSRYVAVSQDRDGWLIVAERDPIRLKKWMAAAGASKAWMVTAPIATLRARARKRGPSCEALLEKWNDYEDDAELIGAGGACGVRMR